MKSHEVVITVGISTEETLRHQGKESLKCECRHVQHEKNIAFSQ